MFHFNAIRNLPEALCKQYYFIEEQHNNSLLPTYSFQFTESGFCLHYVLGARITSLIKSYNKPR